jgi:hypothetical protein
VKILEEGFFEQKERLATASEKFKEKIKHDIGGSIGKIERATIAGLIITGSLVLAYKFTKTLIPGRGKKKSKPKKKSAISEAVKEEGDGSGFLKGVLEIITLFILVIAKEKLEEFIQGEDQ